MPRKTRPGRKPTKRPPSGFAATTERVAVAVGRAVGRMERIVHRATKRMALVARGRRTATPSRVAKRAR